MHPAAPQQIPQRPDRTLPRRSRRITARRTLKYLKRVRKLTGSPNQTDPPYAERRLTYSSSKKEYERTSTKAKPQRDSPAETYFNRPASLTGA